MFRDISKDNTVDDLTRAVADAYAKTDRRRERIAKMVLEADRDALIAVMAAGEVNSLAHAEGELEVYVNALEAAKAVPGKALAAAQQYATRAVLDSPRDTSSGRENDTRRSRFDGVLEAARSIHGTTLWGAV